MSLRSTLLIGTLTILAMQNIAIGQQFSEAVEDNSFFIEEAYNQETRVVQHITNSIYTMNPDHEFTFTFTQEWPVTTETHQLSYTLSFLTLNSNLSHGIGDIVINYRYQLATKENWAAVAPRLSVIIPTGKSDAGLGNGVFGIQGCIPVSKRLSDQFIVHANAGATILPGVKGTTSAGHEVKKTLGSLYFGASGIWLAERHDNLLLESIYTIESSIGANGEVQHDHTILLNPACRHAIDIGGLEIVPGIGFPVTIRRAFTDVGIFFYLSFEHPY
jgi:hypothetical protein